MPSSSSRYDGSPSSSARRRNRSSRFLPISSQISSCCSAASKVVEVPIVLVVVGGGGGGRFLLQSWQRSVVWIVTSRIVTSIGLRSLWNLWLWLLGFWLGTHVQPAGGGKLRTGGCCCCGCGCLGNGAGYGARLRLGGLRLRTGLWMGTCLKLMSLLLLLSCLGWRSGLLKGNLLLLNRYWLLYDQSRRSSSCDGGGGKIDEVVGLVSIFIGPVIVDVPRFFEDLSLPGCPVIGFTTLFSHN